MLWNKESLKSSLQSLLGQKTTPQKPSKPSRKGQPDPRRVEHIRSAMLAELEDAGIEGYEHVAQRLRLARDIEALWYLRADLMYALSNSQGETEARQNMARITPLFNGLLSSGLNSRPSPLGDRPPF